MKVAKLYTRDDIRIEEILVVTFTERATGELKARIRALLGSLLEHEASDPPADANASPGWVLDDGAPWLSDMV